MSGSSPCGSAGYRLDIVCEDAGLSPGIISELRIPSCHKLQLTLFHLPSAFHLTIVFSGFICAVACVRISLYLKAESYSMIWIDHILFISSSIHDTVISTCWVLWLMLQWTWLYKYLSETLLSNSSVCTHKRNWSDCFPQSVPLHIPTSNAQGFQLLSHPCHHVSALSGSHPNRCKGVPQFGFDLHFPQWCPASFLFSA